MEELKTLKDIKDISCQDHFHDDTCYKSDLKQEAIKWVKEIRRITLEKQMHSSSDFLNKLVLDGLELNVWAENYEDYGADSMLRHFFNITEEDLKK